MKQEILHIMPIGLRASVEKMLLERTDAEEIRVRIGQPLEFRCKDKSIWLSQAVTLSDMEEMFTFISRYSIYAYEEEIRQGFLTIEGGNRIGFAGQVRMENGQILHMTHIRFMNIRIAGEHKDCAKTLMPWLFDEMGEFLNTLLISRPGVGKTTFLRDCIRIISNGDGARAGKKVCVIDERSEIAACHLGIPQNDVGKRTDVLDGCLKEEGMRLSLRGMSPEVIAVDELGGKKEAKAVGQILLSGCKILGTVHGEEMGQIVKLAGMKRMCREKWFQRYVFLNKRENGERYFVIYDQEYNRIC